MNDVVITAGTAVGSVLALAEALRKDEVCNVFVLCTNKSATNVIASSKFVTEAYFIQDALGERYVDSIKSWYIDKKFSRKPVLYCTTDTSCFYINQGREWFEQKFILSLPSSEIIKTFSNKGLAEVAAKEAGLKVPRTVILDKNIDLLKSLESFQFPIILKPRAAYLKGNIDFKIKVVDTLSELEGIVSEYLIRDNELLCQEYIEGDANSAFYYVFYRDDNNKVISSIGIKTLQSTPKGGIMLKGSSLFSQELDLLCRDFLEKINYVGIGGIEFKKRGNEFYFIEMSVRLEGFYKIAEASEVPLSQISYQSLTNKKELRLVHQKDGIIYIAWLPTMLSHLKNKNIKELVSDLINSLFNPRYNVNIFSIKSPWPFFKDIAQTFLKRR